MYKYTSTKCSWQHYIFKKLKVVHPVVHLMKANDNPMHAINLLAA